MNRKLSLTSAFIATLLLLAIVSGHFVNLASANFFPEQIPPGIQITSGGAVIGTSLIQRSGDVYTFTGDIYGTIAILRDGIVLDGGGYTLQGSGSGTGVFLQERNNVVIQNMKIVNFGYGIKFTWLNYGSSTARSNTVSGNTIINNTYGVAFYDFSEGNEVSGNYIANNTYGVSLSYSPNNVFRNNQFRNNEGAILDDGQSANDIDTSNTVNGKPVYYWVDQHNRTMPSDAGWVVLKNCSGITVQGLSLEGNAAGVLLCYTNGSTVSGNVITNNLNGVKLEGSSNNVISDNRVAGNNECGIYLDGTSRDNNISDNRIEGNGKDGVSVYAIGSSKGNLVSQNQISNNQGNGISVNGAQKCMIVGNNITLNRGAGICFVYGSSGNVVSGNYIAKNGLGMQLSNAVENTITLNTVTENNGWGIELEDYQKNNVIHHNNFIDNNVTEGLQVRIAGVWSFPGFDTPFINPSNYTQTEPFNEPEPPKFVAGAANAWDNGKEGNYWSDYTTRYPNASAVGTSGVGDTPYFINENNIDRYPLMKPFVPTESSNGENATNPPNFSGSTSPVELGYAIVTVTVVALGAVGGYAFLKRKKSRIATENSMVESKDVIN